MGKTLLLTPGFRFHPTGVELVKYYLKRKVLGKKFSVEAVTELDIYKHDPWDLPGKSCLKSRELKWYFFCPRERKYASGARINRATESGYWKATGKDRSVTYNDEVVGMIKTLIFHRGRAPSGIRTNWVMHEYRLQDKNLIDIQDSYVLCVIFQKEGPGPRNGAQYGAPFREEEWTDDEEEISVGVGPSLPNSQQPDKGHVASRSQISPNQCLGSSSASCMSGLATPSLKVLQPFSSNDFGHNNSVADRPPSPKCTALGSSLESCASGVVTPSCKLPQPVSNKDIEAEMLPALDESDELSLLYKFADEDSFMVDENDNNKATNNVNQRDAVATGAGRSDATDVFEGLTDLGSNVHKPSSHSLDEVFIGDDNGYFLELRDLCTPLVLPDGPKEDEVPFGQLSAPFYCYNSGESSYQANDVDLWSGRARGSEDCYWSNSNIAVQNHTHPWPPEIVHQRAEADTIYGSQKFSMVGRPSK